MDETELHLGPDLATKGLPRLGQQTILRAPGREDVAYLFGSVDPFGGDGLFELYDRKRSEEFCLPLEPLSERYPSLFLVIGGDNAPAHHSHDTPL
jgi:hypothetical protein